jgi:hypothetical protein
MKLRPVSAALATALATAVSLVTPTPAFAAQVSCRVTNNWTCVTRPLNTSDTTRFRVATAGIPNRPSFVIVRDLNLAGHPEVLNELPNVGDEHGHWRQWVYSRYQAELRCPQGCQGATLYFDDWPA